MARWFLTAATAVAIACGDGFLSGPDGPALTFSVIAPTQVEKKAVIDVETRVTRARNVEFPLIVVYEVAYVGDPLREVSRFFLFGDQRVAVARIPVRLDATIRITVMESGEGALSEVKTIEVDVANSP